MTKTCMEFRPNNQFSVSHRGDRIVVYGEVTRDAFIDFVKSNAMTIIEILEVFKKCKKTKNE